LSAVASSIICRLIVVSNVVHYACYTFPPVQTGSGFCPDRQNSRSPQSATSAFVLFVFTYRFWCGSNFESLRISLLLFYLYFTIKDIVVFATVIIVLSTLSLEVGIGAGWTARVRYPTGATFSLFHSVQIDSEAHKVSYPMATDGDFPGGKAAGA
jgi:hypothetical protein